jgi:hypothetical protein
MRGPKIAHIGGGCVDARFCLEHSELTFHGYDAAKMLAHIRELERELDLLEEPDADCPTCGSRYKVKGD